MRTFQTFEIQKEWGNLEKNSRTTQPLKPKQIRICLRAMSLNYRDLLMLRGHYNPHLPLPLTPLSDGVGQVVEIGEQVTRFTKGNRVCLSFCQDWISGAPDSKTLKTTLGGPINGVLAEEIVIQEHGAVLAPSHLTDEEAACLPCASLTAWSALFTYASLRPKDTVLLLGSGGVSIFALQLAKAAGANVIITSSSDQKLERARKLGADDTINYKKDPNWGKTIKKRTGGVDHVVEVGGANTLAQSIKATRPGGQIALIGVLSGTQKKLNLLPILMQNIRIQGIFVGHRQGFEAMNQFITKKNIRPIIDRTFTFQQAKQAFTYLSKGVHFGKIVIKH